MPNPTRGDVHVNKPLTNVSIAYIQKATNFIADKVFPNIPVPKQSDRYFVYDRGDWFRDEAQKRAPGTESAGGGFRIDNTPTYYADTWGVHKDVDDQIRANADVPINMDRDATEYITGQLLLKREKQWAADYFVTGIWTTQYQGVSSGPTGAQFLQWNDAASTPIEDITNRAIDIAKLTGFKPNTLVLSPYVFNTLKSNADIIDRIKYTQKGVITTDILANLFEVEKVLVAMGTNNTAAEGATDSYDFIISSKAALLCYSNPRPSILTPSAGYTFSWTGYLGAGVAGNRIKRFRMEELASDRIEGEMAFDLKLVAADLGAFFYDAIA